MTEMNQVLAASSNINIYSEKRCRIKNPVRFTLLFVHSAHIQTEQKRKNNRKMNAVLCDFRSYRSYAVEFFILMDLFTKTVKTTWFSQCKICKDGNDDDDDSNIEQRKTSCLKLLFSANKFFKLMLIPYSCDMDMANKHNPIANCPFNAHHSIYSKKHHQQQCHFPQFTRETLQHWTNVLFILFNFVHFFFFFFSILLSSDPKQSLRS